MLRILCLTAAFFMVLAPLETFAQDHAGYRLLQLDGQTVKWGAGAYGEGATLTYAFIAQTTEFDDARNCRAMAPVDAVLEASGLEASDFDAAVAQAFAMWQTAAGVSFKKSDDPAAADILIGVDLEGRGWAHADVRAAPSTGEVRKITRGLVCLSADKAWKIGFGSNPGAQDIRYTISHEIGHVLGLNHPSPSGQVMSFTYSEGFADLQSGDIEGARALYGAPAPSSPAIASAPANTTIANAPVSQAR